jgi:hypothetical protein
MAEDCLTVVVLKMAQMNKASWCPCPCGAFKCSNGSELLGDLLQSTGCVRENDTNTVLALGLSLTKD